MTKYTLSFCIQFQLKRESKAKLILLKATNVIKLFFHDGNWSGYQQLGQYTMAQSR